MHKSLTKCDLFRGLTDEKIAELIGKNSYSITDFTDGEVIAQRGTAYSGLMIILEGGVIGENLSSAGKVIRTDIFRAPQLISPAFLFGGYNRLPIEVIASGAVKIMTIHRASLFEMMQDNVIVLSNFIDIISNRANLLTKKLFFLSFESLKEQTATYLLEHAHQGGNTPLDTKALADYFEVRLDSLERVLHDIVQTGAITLNQGVIQVVNKIPLTK